jgi:hypothetical protein
VETGLTLSENLRKLMSGDDSGNNTGDDKIVYGIYGKQLKKPVNKILKDHGLFVPFHMNNNPMYILTLPKSGDVLTPQSGEVIGSYSLDNLALEYETIENSDLADDITSLYTCGRSLSYQHVTLMRIN